MMQHHDHRHLIIRAIVDYPPLTVRAADRFLVELVDAVGMRVLSGPHGVACFDEGNEGITSTIVLSTSHASLHSWHDYRLLQADIYSCRPFDPNNVLRVLNDHFGIEHVDTISIDRNDGVKPC